MAAPEEINKQQRLLETHRRTLAHYLQQQAALSTAYTSPQIAHGIQEARDNIQRIKTILRSWDVQIEDHPDDQEPSVAQISRSSYLKSRAESSHIFIFAGIGSTVVLLVMLSVAILSRNPSQSNNPIIPTREISTSVITLSVRAIALEMLSKMA